MTSDRNFTITGYVNTSHGKVTTSISQRQNFASHQTIDFDTVHFTVLDQKTSLDTSVASSTTVTGDYGTTVTQEKFSFPMTVDLSYPLKDLSSATTTTTQRYQVSKLVSQNGVEWDYTSLSNSVSATNVSPASSSQQYTVIEGVSGGNLNLEGGVDRLEPQDLKHRSYSCEIASKNNVLTFVSPRCGR